jgi:alanyl-tRNA synthetase
LAAEAKPMLLIVVSDRAISEKKLKANELADRIAKSFSLRGGGKPHMAQMGLARADDFERVKAFVREVLENLG